jgi:hypothetical protein
MNRHEKIAWYNLAVITISVLLFLVLFFVVKNTHSLELSFRISCSAFAVLAFLAFGQTLFRKEDREKMDMGFYDPELDERDIQIYRRAKLHAFSVFWGLYVLITMGFWMYLRWKHGMEGDVILTLNVNLLPCLLWPSAIIIIAVHAVSTIIQHRRGAVDDNSFQGMLVPNKRALIGSLFMLMGFILISIFIAFQGAPLFGFQFATLGFGSSAMAVHEIRRKEVHLEDNRQARGFIILGRIINTLFTLMFGGLIVTFLVRYSEYGPLRIPSLFILVFIALIFQRSVLKDLKSYLRERRHEKA